MSSSAPINVKNPQLNPNTITQNSTQTAAVAAKMSDLSQKMNIDAVAVNAASQDVTNKTTALNTAQTAYNEHPSKENLKTLNEAQQGLANAQADYKAAVSNLAKDNSAMKQFLTQELPAARQKDAADAQFAKQSDDQIKDANAKSDQLIKNAEDTAADMETKVKEGNDKIAKFPSTSSAGGIGDSYSNKARVGAGADAGAPNASPSDITSEDEAVDNKVITASASGSSVDAASVLKDNGISDPVSYWQSQQDKLVGKRISKELFDNILDTLQNSGTDAQGKDKADAKNTAKGKGKAAVGVGAGANAGAPAGGAGNGLVGAGADAGAPAGTASSSPTRLVGAGANSGAPGEAVQVDPSNLSPMEIMMLVMLMATDELNKEIQQVAKDLQNSTAEKNQIRQALSDNNQHISYDANDNSLESSQAKKNQTNLQNKLDSIGDDTQMMQMRLQNLMQMQQQFIQAVSNISKSLADNSMAILRHIGS
jgi:hypothetical protein